MIIYDSGYNKLVSKYIAPLADYGVPYSKLRQHHIKALLLEKTKAVVPLSNGNFVFFFNKDEIIKALIGDANLFYLRTLLQKNTATRLAACKPQIFADWMFVTDYYYSFFVSNLLLRLCHRGTLFFDDNYKKQLNEIIYTFHPSGGCTGKNYSYKVILNDAAGDYQLCLEASAHSTHELVWENIAGIISEIKNNSVQKSDEYTLLSIIDEINRKQGKAFPSKLRNQINYQPYYGVKTIRKDIFPPSFDLKKWLMPIFCYPGRKVDDEQKLIELFAAYVHYLERLTFNLLLQYEELYKRENGILSAVNKNKEEKITIPEQIFTYP